MPDFVLCSQCFRDQGLRLDAEKLGIEDSSECPRCRGTQGRKLDSESAEYLAYRFFVWGTLNRTKYGGAPIIQFNEHQRTSPDTLPRLQDDMRVFENAIGVGFFEYGPRTWMIGQVNPLLDLQNKEKRRGVIKRILGAYPQVVLKQSDFFYRLRKAPLQPDSPTEYDSPPDKDRKYKRLDSEVLNAMYGSQDLHTCIHECRVVAEDELFVATLVPSHELRLLDLTELLHEDASEFDSLDIAIHMLFLAGEHSYEITREIAVAASREGFDGVVYPSYFSLLRTGSVPFQTSYGISLRRFPSLVGVEKSKTIPNLAIFGRPIEAGLVEVRCINRLTLSRVDYSYVFGPSEC